MRDKSHTGALLLAGLPESADRADWPRQNLAAEKWLESRAAMSAFTQVGEMVRITAR